MISCLFVCFFQQVYGEQESIDVIRQLQKLKQVCSYRLSYKYYTMESV